MKNILFAAIVLCACRSSAKNVASHNGIPADTATKGEPHITVYRTTGVFTADTTLRKH